MSASRPFLSNYIQSLTSARQAKVADLLHLATLSKTDLSVVANLLTNQFNLNILSLSNMDAGGMLSAADWQLNLREITLQLNDLFNLANLIGLLLDTDQKNLNSKIQSLQTQLSALEVQAANFEFLAADGGTFNYAYMEVFHDLLGQGTFRWPISDRDGTTFSPELQQATILTNEGALVLPDDLVLNLASSAQLYKTNASAHVTSDTGIANTLVHNSATGWRLAISSPTPIQSPLSQAFVGYNGAQAILEYTLNQPSACTEIKIVPLASNAIDLVKIIVYKSSSDHVGTVLTLPTSTLNQETNIHFPITNIQRFEIYINQVQYTRSNTYSNNSENQYRQLYNNVVSTTSNNYIQFSGSAESFNSLPKYSIASVKSYDTDLSDYLRSIKTRLGPAQAWSQSSVYNSSFLHLFSQWQGVYKTIFTNNITTPTDSPGKPPLASILANAPNPVTAYPAIPSNSIASNLNYDYVLGLQYVGIGIDIPEYKGVYVSTIIPSSGDMGEVEIKVKDSNYVDTSNTLDNPILTSIEYSVTNQSSPISESDWTPILPISTVNIGSERLFPNVSGTCLFRFGADPNEVLTVYKNGYQTTNFDKQFDNTDNYITGVTLVPKTFTSNDIFTISYTPVGNSSLVDFTNQGFSNAPLISATDANGSGESFIGTGARNTVQLSNIPYVDPNQVTNTSYQPITVIFQSGTTATNLTNYITGAQPVFPSGGYYFIQSGNVIMFNQPVTTPFRVYYQYIQNNVRFRVVLRVNTINFVSPKVNMVQLKAQTRLPNAIQSL